MGVLEDLSLQEEVAVFVKKAVFVLEYQTVLLSYLRLLDVDQMLLDPPTMRQLVCVIFVSG